jgi:hypothetical protein
MGAILTNVGEEWYHKTDVSAVTSLTYGLYDDSTDTVSDSDDISSLTTEPDSANTYARQSANISVSDISGDVGFDNDSTITFDLSTNTSGSVDSYFIVATFQSDVVNSETSSNDHMIITGSLSQSYTLSDVDTLDISAGTAGNSIN